MINFWVYGLVVALVKFLSHKIFLPILNANWILGSGFWVFMWSFNIVSDSKHIQPTQKINLRQPVEVKTKTYVVGA